TVQKHSLLTFDKSAVEEVVKYGIKLAGRKDKLSTLFAEIEELIQEANYWAVKRGGKKVVLKDILKAVKEHKNRLNLYEDKLLEYYKKEILRIKVDGEEIGIVNGLAVISTGEYTFGRPVRISARVGLGTAGIINIEREAELSGKIHHKGVLILEGFLKEKFAREVPLVMDATICFEQSYTGVEGDSASSAELYALLSAMAHIPIKQNLAITGSVNQKGEIQAIGGVNEKITGFFNACKIKGFTGNQGVIIPESNIAEVMLDDEISKEIKKGRFHIYAISHIDEGIPLLFGVSAEVLYRRVLNFLKENVLRWRKYMGVGWRR
ncbi:MAG TPA: ATP-dependent protease, partial [Candidatus Aenigmarchaeota archaeon]|nr:ATP-dependent protease [Candidatus Aenigmarchaeota archaeon]